MPLGDLLEYVATLYEDVPRLTRINETVKNDQVFALICPN